MSRNQGCRCECKELVGKGICDKGFIFNPSICECECDKSCSIGEYLDYESYCIICSIFNNKCNNWQWFCLFLLV